MSFGSIVGSLLQGAGGLMSAIPVVGSVIGGATSVLGSVIGGQASKNEAYEQWKRESNFNAEQAQLNRDFQEQERLETQQFNLDMWNMNNEYNSLASQIQRAKDAGVNPAAVLENSTSQPVTSSPMSGNAASAGGSIAASILTQDLELQKMMAQNRLLSAQATKEEINNGSLKQLNEANIKKLEAEADKTLADKGFTEEQCKQAKELFPLLKGKNEQELTNMEKELDLLFAQISEIEKKNEVADSTIALNEASTSNLSEDAKVKEWKRKFQEQFGVMPDSGLVDGIIQLAVSGEKGATVANTLVNTILHMAKGAIVDTTVDVIEWIAENEDKPKLPSYGYTDGGNSSTYR